MTRRHEARRAFKMALYDQAFKSETGAKLDTDEPFPDEWGFTYPLGLVAIFYSRWRRSGFVLTMTGSFERDYLEYKEFWADVYLYDFLYQEQLEIVQNAIMANTAGANPLAAYG